MPDRPREGDRHRFTISAQDERAVSAQLFYDGDQWAEIVDDGGAARVMVFGPGEGEPPTMDLSLALAQLRDAARALVGRDY